MDSPDQLAQPMGEIRDWRNGDTELVAGKTFPNIAIVERDYTKVYDKLVSLGPLVSQPKGYGSKGQYTDLTPIVEEELKHNEALDVKHGRVYFEKPEQACELILQISPELNGRLSSLFFKEMEKKVGLPLADMVEVVKGRKVHYKDIISQPRRIHTTPQWSAMLHDEGRQTENFRPVDNECGTPEALAHPFGAAGNLLRPPGHPGTGRGAAYQQAAVGYGGDRRYQYG